VSWLRDGLLGNDAGEGPQWGWVQSFDRWSDRLWGRDDLSELERAIAHNEARGDGAAVPEGWRAAAEAGCETFAEADQGGWLQ
jgi:hypothetical protein